MNEKPDSIIRIDRLKQGSSYLVERGGCDYLVSTALNGDLSYTPGKRNKNEFQITGVPIIGEANLETHIAVRDIREKSRNSAKKRGFLGWLGL